MSTAWIVFHVGEGERVTFSPWCVPVVIVDILKDIEGRKPKIFLEIHLSFSTQPWNKLGPTFSGSLHESLDHESLDHERLGWWEEGQLQGSGRDIDLVGINFDGAQMCGISKIPLGHSVSAGFFKKNLQYESPWELRIDSP